MEERRLTNLLCHLSAYSSSRLAHPSAMNATGKAENHTLFFPGDAHWQPEVHSVISRSRSSSDMFESRRFDFLEEAHMGADSWYANPSKELPSHSHSCVSAVEENCRGSLHTKSLSLKFLGDSYGLEGHTQGCSLKADSKCFQPDCSSSGTVTYERSMQCKSLHSKNEIEVGIQEECNDSRHDVFSERRVSTDLNQISHGPFFSSQSDHHEVVMHECQIRTRSSDRMQNTCESDVCRDTPLLEPETIEAANDNSSGSISRNNAMTGQRMRLVEDCIFCLVIQGQSPSFKLYEDELCICILDVHPLSHGHALLIPKAHFPSLEFTPPEVAAAMCATVPLISMAIMQATNCDSFNLLVNSGKAAGQVVFHTHFHIIPRRTGDNLWRSEDGNRRALPIGHETALLVQQIRHNLSSKHL